jgi:hypothetical protein
MIVPVKFLQNLLAVAIGKLLLMLLKDLIVNLKMFQTLASMRTCVSFVS